MSPANEPNAGWPFAPYPVWMAMRLVSMMGSALFLLWFTWMIVALLSAISRGDIAPLPMWIGIVGLIVGGSGHGFRRDENVSLFGELIGRSFASKACPACGQSVFDHTPPTGYAPDSRTYAWWPSKFCTNCGHDMRKRTAS